MLGTNYTMLGTNYTMLGTNHAMLGCYLVCVKGGEGVTDKVLKAEEALRPAFP